MDLLENNTRGIGFAHKSINNSSFIFLRRKLTKINELEIAPVKFSFLLITRFLLGKSQFFSATKSIFKSYKDVPNFHYVDSKVNSSKKIPDNLSNFRAYWLIMLSLCTDGPCRQQRWSEEAKKNIANYRKVCSCPSTYKFLKVVGCEHVAAKEAERNEGYRKGHRGSKISLWRPTYLTIS